MPDNWTPATDQISGMVRRVCRDCAYCHDGGNPEFMSMWLCMHDEAMPLVCFDARYEADACGIGAKWFKPA